MEYWKYIRIWHTFHCPITLTQVKQLSVWSIAYMTNIYVYLKLFESFLEFGTSLQIINIHLRSTVLPV